MAKGDYCYAYTEEEVDVTDAGWGNDLLEPYRFSQRFDKNRPILLQPDIDKMNKAMTSNPARVHVVIIYTFIGINKKSVAYTLYDSRNKK